jgi:negative regulator of flagellin synthesis FlgM
LTNKISGYPPAEAIAPKGTVAAPATDKTQTEASVASATPSADHLTLTSSARSLQKIEQAVAKTPVVNATKVAAIKQSVQSGSYQIDANSVAGNILSFESNLK